MSEKLETIRGLVTGLNESELDQVQRYVDDQRRALATVNASKIVGAKEMSGKNVDAFTVVIGARVTFGRPNGKQHTGSIVGVGRTRLKVKEDGTGTVWTGAPVLFRYI